MIASLSVSAATEICFNVSIKPFPCKALNPYWIPNFSNSFLAVSLGLANAVILALNAVVAKSVFNPCLVKTAIAESKSLYPTPACFAIGAILPILFDNSSTVVLPNFCAEKNALATSVASFVSKPKAFITLVIPSVAVVKSVTPPIANSDATRKKSTASAAGTPADTASNNALFISPISKPNSFITSIAPACKLSPNLFISSLLIKDNTLVNPFSNSPKSADKVDTTLLTA